jgi:hypothetical protein
VPTWIEVVSGEIEKKDLALIFDYYWDSKENYPN